MDDKGKIAAIVALVLGILGLGAWCIPICGGPLAILGIVLGILGLRSEGKIMAIIGLAMNALVLLASMGNAVWGMKMMMDGSHPFASPPGQVAPAGPPQPFAPVTEPGPAPAQGTTP